LAVYILKKCYVLEKRFFRNGEKKKMAGIKKSPSALAGGKGDPTLREQYQKARSYGLKIAKFYDPCNEKHVKVATEMRDCRTWFEYDHFISSAENKIVSGFSCKHYSLCPSCAMARSRKVFHKTKEKLLALELPVQQIKLLTITVKNTVDFSEGLKKIRKFYSSLVQSRKNGAKRSFDINTSPFVAVDGWIGRYEVTRNKKDGSWHPHLHLMIVVNSEYTELFKRGKHDYKFGDAQGFFKNAFSKLMAERLYKFTGDSFMIDCRDVKESDFEENKKLGSAAEVSKYLFKFGDLKGKEFWQVYDSTRGMRLGVCGGLFRGISLDPDTLNEEEPKDDEKQLPRIRYDMKWKDSASKYHRSIVEVVNLPELTDEEWKIYESDEGREGRVAFAVSDLKNKGYSILFKSYAQDGTFTIGGVSGFDTGLEFATTLCYDPEELEESGFPRYFRFEFLYEELLCGRHRVHYYDEYGDRFEEDRFYSTPQILPSEYFDVDF